jgi:hypothetical protein
MARKKYEVDSKVHCGKTPSLFDGWQCALDTLLVYRNIS